MKGIIFNLLEEVVTEEYGPDVWDDLLDDAGVEGSYTSLGNYADEEFLSLLGRLPEGTGRDGADQLRWFGRAAMPLLGERYPVFFTQHPSTRSFLRSVNDVIHEEVRKLYPGADVPTFDYEPPPAGDDSLVVLGYRSTRRLCALAEGFIQGVADRYGEAVTIEQPQCMHRGDDRCTLVCSLSPTG